MWVAVSDERLEVTVDQGCSGHGSLGKVGVAVEKAEEVAGHPSVHKHDSDQSTGEVALVLEGE